MNRQSNKITAIYTRIDYPGNSECIQRQEQALRKYAEKMGVPNLAFYSDDGYNGADPGRPDFQWLLNDIKQGKVENIVVHSLDRLYRDYMSIMSVTTVLTAIYIYECFPSWKRMCGSPASFRIFLWRLTTESGWYISMVIGEGNR